MPLFDPHLCVYIGSLSDGCSSRGGREEGLLVVQIYHRDGDCGADNKGRKARITSLREEGEKLFKFYTLINGILSLA